MGSVRNCIELTKALDEDDVSDVLAALDRYRLRGVDLATAQRKAVADILASVEGERTDLMAAVRKQHPDLFGSKAPEDFTLEQPTPEGLRAKAEAEKRAADEQAKADKAPPPEDFTLTGSDRPADEAAARGQEELFKAAEQGQEAANGGPKGGTLYSNPVGPIMSALKQIMGIDSAEYRQRTEALRRAAEEDRASSALPGKSAAKRALNATVDIAQTLIGGNIGMLEILSRRFKSPTIDSLIGEFSERTGTDKGGKRTWRQDTDARYFAAVNRIARALDFEVGGKRPLSDSALFDQIAAKVKNRSSIPKDGKPLNKAALEIAALLDETHQILRDAGVDVGKFKDYFPDREFNISKILADPAAFVRAARDAYAKDGYSDPAARAQALADAIIFNEHGATGSMFIARNASAPSDNFTMSRVFSNAAAERLSAFYHPNKFEALQSYLHRAYRRAAFESRFGGVDKDGRGNAKWRKIEEAMVAEGNAQAIEPVKQVLQAIMGEVPNGIGLTARRAVSWLRTAQVLTFLSGPGTVMASMLEPALVPSRTGHLSSAPGAAANYLNGIRNEMGRRIPGLSALKSGKIEEAGRVAELVGVVTHHLVNDPLVIARIGASPSSGSGTANLLSGIALRWSGLEPLTIAQRNAMTATAGTAIGQLAEGIKAGGKLDAQLLVELGIPRAKQDAFVSWLAAQRAGKWGGVDRAALETRGEMQDLYKGAVYNFVNGVITNPTKASKPKYASHPTLGVAYDLMSFLHEFHEQQIKRAYRMTKDALNPKSDFSAGDRARMMLPAATLAVALPLRDMILLDDLEEAAKRRDKASVAGIPGWVIEAYSRAGTAGRLDPLLNAIKGVRYNRDLANLLPGPEIGALAGGAQAFINLTDDEKNSAYTNSAERTAAKAFWNLFAEPGLTAAGIVGLPAPLGIPLQAGLKTRMAEEAFVSAVAGEKPPTDPLERRLWNAQNPDAVSARIERRMRRAEEVD